MRTKVEYLVGMSGDDTPPAASAGAEVVLSERNLLGMVAKLYQPGSACTIINNEVRWNGQERSDIPVVLRVEKDDAHYDRPVGPMHPETEAFVNKLREFLKEHEHMLGPAM